MNPLLLKFAPYAAAALVAFGIGWTTNGWRLDAQIESLKAEHSQIVAQAAVQALMDQDVQRDREKALQRKVDDGNTKLQSDQKLIAGLRTDTGRMRQSIADYARGSEAADTSAAACRDRADTLGKLLDESMRVQEDLAVGAETESARVRALLEGWPR